jgi:Flagellar hook-length control protein FliK
LPDPNPIALWSVDRQSLLALQPGRSGLQASLANGNVVKARIIAMLSGDVAQLEILGQKVEVSTPQALEVGATISVAINGAGQSLELIIQPDANNSRAPAPQPVAGSGRNHITPNKALGSSQSLAVSIEDWVLTAQAAINDAVRSSEPNFQNPNLAPAQPGMPAAYPAAAFASQAQLQAEIRARYEWDVAPAAPGFAEDQDLVPPPSASKASQHMPPTAVLSPVSGQPASNSALVIEAPFQLPQMQRPILMTIQQDDESEAQPASRPQAAKRWTVNFSLDAGSYGQIQVTIGLSAAAVSVRLSSDQTESAALLSVWLPELKAALEEADFAVDELTVRKTVSFDSANRTPILL